MSKEEPWHRRHALQLASQLPEKREDALAVIRALERLLADFLTEPEEVDKPATVLSLVRDHPA